MLTEYKNTLSKNIETRKEELKEMETAIAELHDLFEEAYYFLNEEKCKVLKSTKCFVNTGKSKKANTFFNTKSFANFSFNKKMAEFLEKHKDCQPVVLMISTNNPSQSFDRAVQNIKNDFKKSNFLAYNQETNTVNIDIEKFTNFNRAYINQIEALQGTLAKDLTIYEKDYEMCKSGLNSLKAANNAPANVRKR